MTIPLQVLVSMGRFAVHPYTEGIVCLWFDQGIKKRDSPILLITFDCELYTWIYAVDVIQEKLLMDLLLHDPSVIHKPIPIPGGYEVDLSTSPSKCSLYRLATMGLTSDPWLHLPPVHRTYFERRSRYYADMMFCTDNTLLLLKVSSFSNRSLITLSAGSMGTEVNNVVTS